MVMYAGFVAGGLVRAAGGDVIAATPVLGEEAVLAAPPPELELELDPAFEPELLLLLRPGGRSEPS